MFQLFFLFSLFEKLASCHQVPLNTAKSRADEWQVRLLYIFNIFLVFRISSVLVQIRIQIVLFSSAALFFLSFTHSRFIYTSLQKQKIFRSPTTKKIQDLSQFFIFMLSTRTYCRCLHLYDFQQCFGSGSSWIRIKCCSPGSGLLGMRIRVWIEKQGY
jgi:hypothetical protein